MTVTGVPSGFTLSTYASGLNFNQDMALDHSGNLYIANQSGGDVIEVTPQGVSRIFASGFTQPKGLAFDSQGNLYVSNQTGDSISKVTPAGVVSTFVASINQPGGLAVDANNNLYVTNEGNGTVSKVTPAGVVSVFATTGWYPRGLAFDANGNLFVSNEGSETISEVTPAGVVSTFVSSGLSGPAGLAFDSSGNLYVANYNNYTVSEISPGGAVSTVISSGLSGPTDVAVDSQGNLYVSNGYADTVSKWAAPTVTFSVAFSDAAKLPLIGLALEPNGSFSGQVTNMPLNNPVTFTVNVTDNVGDTGSATIALYVGSWGLLPNPLVWTGQGTVSTNWSDPENWNLDTVPAANDSLIFPAGAPTTSNNDLTGLALDAIYLQGSGYTLTGNAVTASLGIGNSGIGNTYDLDTTLVGPAWTPGTPLDNSSAIFDVLGGTLQLGGNEIVQFGSTLQVAAGAVVAIDGSGAINLGPGGTAKVQGTLNVQSGGTYIMSSLDGSGNDVASVPGMLNVLSGGSLLVGQNSDGGSALSELDVPGTLDVQTGGSLQVGNETPGSGGLGLVQVDPGGQVTIAGTGTVVDASSLQVGSAGSGTGGTSLAQLDVLGTLDVQTGASLQVGFAGLSSGGNGLAVVDSTGTVNLDGSANVQTASTFQIDGTLDPATGGSINVADTSNLIVGSTGSVTVGNLQLSDDSTATIDGALTVPAGGTVVVTGLAQLDTQNAVSVSIAGTELTWAQPASITYGTPLGTDQLAAAANVPGTFVYNPPLGTVLNAGAGQTLSVTFTPNDAVDYSSATASVSLDVVKADQTISWTPLESTITYGTALGASQLNAGVSVVGPASAGALSYTPASGTVLGPGSQTVTVTAAGTADYNQASQSVTITVNQAPAFTSAASTTFTAGTAGSFTFTTTGFPAPTLTESGSLPGRLTFVDNGNGTATLSGPAAPAIGTYMFDVSAVNSTGTVTQVFALTVIDPPSFTSENTVTFTVAQRGTFSVTTMAGLPTATTLSESGKLPPGVSFAPGSNGTATLSGTPAAGSSGIYPLTITAGNAANSTTTQSFTLTVDQTPAITSAKSAIFVMGQANTFTVTTTGFPCAVFKPLPSNMPPGLTCHDNGNGTATISGTPTATGPTTMTITASNGSGTAASQSFTINVDRAPTLATSGSSTFSVGKAGSYTVTASDGVPTTTTFTETGNLPSGLTFKDSGKGTATISGTPAGSTGGPYSITIIARNSTATSTTLNLNVYVDQGPAITSAKSTIFVEGQTNTFTVTTTGYPKAAFNPLPSNLPAGIIFHDNGDGTATISGKPTATGPTTITITASNGIGTAASQSFTINVDRLPTLATSGSSTFSVGKAGSFSVAASGGVPTTTTFTENGILPSGLIFKDNGRGTATISGTPAAGTGGTYSITITAKNSSATSATQNFTLTVDQTPAIISAKNTTFTVGQTANFTVATTGFPAVGISITGTLPAGLSFVDNHNGTASLSGVPQAGSGGIYTLTFTATNSISSVTQTFTLTVNQVAVITSVNSFSFSFGKTNSFTFTTEGFPVATFTESGTLPTGLTFVSNGDGTATLKGTPTVRGTFSFIVRASNKLSPVAFQLFTLTIS